MIILKIKNIFAFNLIQKKMRFLLIISILINLTSCNLKKKLIYFNNDTNNDSTVVHIKPTSIKFKIDDIISVDVSAFDLESVAPFTKTPNTSPSTQVPSYSNGIAANGGYLIANDGTINLPLLGKTKIAGLTRNEATELIQSKLSNYLTDPIVSLKLLNFKITILGDVKIPGTYTIPNERLSLTEAIGLAGDLNITGIRNNILVIREENGVKKEYRVDLTNQSIYSSEVYYLRQNDVIYVEPNRAKRNSSVISSTAGVFISIASLLITTINVITK